eukprot:GILJ01009293.1.p1 GENE.GILJ01009293.1~~GILJ01009293.1.p1  ORF type:complete len:584 (-),score=98.10 GILJ01009293.1:207-1958(-)
MAYHEPYFFPISKRRRKRVDARLDPMQHHSRHQQHVESDEEDDYEYANAGYPYPSYPPPPMMPTHMYNYYPPYPAPYGYSPPPTMPMPMPMHMPMYPPYGYLPPPPPPPPHGYYNHRPARRLYKDRMRAASEPSSTVESSEEEDEVAARVRYHRSPHEVRHRHNRSSEAHRREPLVKSPLSKHQQHTDEDIYISRQHKQHTDEDMYVSRQHKQYADEDIYISGKQKTYKQRQRQQQRDSDMYNGHAVTIQKHWKGGQTRVGEASEILIEYRHANQVVENLLEEFISDSFIPDLLMEVVTSEQKEWKPDSNMKQLEFEIYQECAKETVYELSCEIIREYSREHLNDYLRQVRAAKGPVDPLQTVGNDILDEVVQNLVLDTVRSTVKDMVELEMWQFKYEPAYNHILKEVITDVAVSCLTDFKLPQLATESMNELIQDEIKSIASSSLIEVLAESNDKEHTSILKTCDEQLDESILSYLIEAMVSTNNSDYILEYTESRIDDWMLEMILQQASSTSNSTLLQVDSHQPSVESSTNRITINDNHVIQPAVVISDSNGRASTPISVQVGPSSRSSTASVPKLTLSVP